MQLGCVLLKRSFFAHACSHSVKRTMFSNRVSLMEKLDSRDDSKVLRLLKFVGLVSKCDMETVFWMNDNNQEQ